MKKVANFVLFQASWFALVLSVEKTWTWLAFAFVAVALALHFLWISDNARRDALLVAIVSPLGLVLDTALAHGAVLQYRGAELLGFFAPAWILALWAVFAMTFHSSMSWMQGRYKAAAWFAGLGAPLSYAAAARSSAVAFMDPTWRSVAIVAVSWALAMPLFLWLSVRCAQFATVGRVQSPKAA